jgi:hypothetical protein
MARQKKTAKDMTAMDRMYDEMVTRAAHGVEDANPGDREPIIDRIDLSRGFEEDNVRIISGLAYKMRHYLWDVR